MITKEGGAIIKTVIVRIDDDIHQQLKVSTVQNKISIQELLETFIKKYVEENSNYIQK